ncbi:Uncharacterised protein [Vibrio cholerae]|nr:Uncharacterised protein [Vibrio cholerae]
MQHLAQYNVKTASKNSCKLIRLKRFTMLQLINTFLSLKIMLSKAFATMSLEH